AGRTSVDSTRAAVGIRASRWPPRSSSPIIRSVRALAVCQDELVIRTLHRVLSGVFDIEFLIESRPLARRLVDDGVAATVADPTRVDSYLRRSEERRVGKGCGSRLRQAT